MKTAKNKPKPHVIRVPKQYAGEYVAYRSWRSKKVVAHNKDATIVYQDALRLGAKEPVLMFVRDPNIIGVY